MWAYLYFGCQHSLLVTIIVPIGPTMINIFLKDIRRLGQKYTINI